MDELFGIPTNQLTLVLFGAFAAGAVILAVLAARDRTSLRMAVRNIPRRKTQSTLIVTGLMLATVLFSAAFTTGDTLTNSLRTQALEDIGRVDVVVKAKQPESDVGAAWGPGVTVTPEAREKYFDEDLVGEIRNRLSGVGSVTGVAPLAKESVPVTSTRTDLSEPRVDVLGVDADSMHGFDHLTTASGDTLSVTDLGENRVYLGAQTAEGLGVEAGDSVEASLIPPAKETRSEASPERKLRPGAAQRPPGRPEAGNPPASFEGGARPVGRADNGRPDLPAIEQSPPKLEVAGIYERGANPASETSMVMPLKDLQELVGEEGRINEILVTHRGPAVEGGKYTDTTVDRIDSILSANDLVADPVKKDAIDQADSRGEIFSTLFVLFGQFSVAAGMLLI